MFTQSAETLGASSTGFVFALFAVGLLVVAGLIWTVSFGRKVRRRELPPPGPEEQPRLPESGPVREESQRREPDEVPTTGERLRPHDLKGFGNSGSRPSDDQRHRR